MIAGRGTELAPQDEADIRHILDRYMRLWMDGRAQACADLYEEGGDALGVDGTFLRGRDEIRRYYEDVMTGKYSGFKVENVQHLGIRPLGEGVALLDARWEVHRPSDDGSSWAIVGTPMCSLIVTRTQEGWKITAARLMEPMKLGTETEG